MGSHGRTRPGRMLVGSVAEKVVRNATCPVLILRNRAEASPAREVEAMSFASQ
jgi:hypothetical protein